MNRPGPDTRYHEEELHRLFTLSPDDLAVLETARGDNRLALALILVWARVERVLPADPRDLPVPVIAFVSAQLGLDSGALATYQGATTTRARHLGIVREHLQLRSFQAEDSDRLYAHLYEKAAHTGDAAALLDAAEAWLLREVICDN